MYCRIAVIDYNNEASIVLLPYEKKEQFQPELWCAFLEQGACMYIYEQPLALFLADWIARNVPLCMKNIGKSAHSAKLFMQSINRQVLEFSGGDSRKARWRKCTPSEDITTHANHDTLFLAMIGFSALQNPVSRQQLKERVVHMLQGRKLLYDEWVNLLSRQLDYNAEEIELILRMLIMQGVMQLRCALELTSYKRNKMSFRCLRCYETSVVQAKRACPYCGPLCYYCETCLQMGRARTCSILIIGHYHAAVTEAATAFRPEQVLQLESFGLSDAQSMATRTALAYVYECLGRARVIAPTSTGQAGSNQFLLWAVTGAGKTEMIFPLVAYMVRLGGRVLLATPRRDVVLELSPRLHKAFPDLHIATLYGGSEEKWQSGQLIIATTHQLMRFQKCFDLVIIDELDAFPYHGDERLYRVAEQCSTNSGVRILLSATPPAYLQKEIKRGKLPHVKLPVRYHRHPLPVPQRLKTPLIAHQLHKKSIPSLLIKALQQSLREEAQVFIFLQRIIYTEPYAQLLRNLFPGVVIEATSSQDAARSEKVMAFRNRSITILVTTTILERGVTVPRSHVYICDAEAALFDEASLVQMSGRAGRSKDEPKGAVYFLSEQWNAAQRNAIKQIKTMNKLAGQMGYLLPQYIKGREYK